MTNPISNSYVDQIEKRLRKDPQRMTSADIVRSMIERIRRDDETIRQLRARVAELQADSGAGTLEEPNR